MYLRVPSFSVSATSVVATSWDPGGMLLEGSRSVLTLHSLRTTAEFLFYNELNFFNLYTLFNLLNK